MTSTTPRADLNAHAKEFVPSFSPPPAPRSPQPLTATLLSTTSTGVQLVAYYDDQGRYLYTGPYDPYVAGLAEYTAWDDRATPGGEGEAGTLTVDQAYVDAALAMLADAFPLYSTEQLFATFAEQVVWVFWGGGGGAWIVVVHCGVVLPCVRTHVAACTQDMHHLSCTQPHAQQTYNTHIHDRGMMWCPLVTCLCH